MRPQKYAMPGASSLRPALTVVGVCLFGACGARTALEEAAGNTAAAGGAYGVTALTPSGATTVQSPGPGALQREPATGASAGSEGAPDGQASAAAPPNASTLPSAAPLLTEPVPETFSAKDFALGGRTEEPAANPALLPPPPDVARPLTLNPAPWRESAEPFCDALVGDGRSTALWADDDGIAALSFDGTGADVRHNDGSGWKWLWGHPQRGAKLLAGYPGGTRLIIAGYGFVVDLGLDGSLGAGADIALTSPVALVGASKDLAYGAVQSCGLGAGCGVVALLRGTATGWFRHSISADSMAAFGMAADANTVFLAGPREGVVAGTAAGDFQFESLSVEGLDSEVKPAVLTKRGDGPLWGFERQGLLPTSAVRYEDGQWSQVAPQTGHVLSAWSDGQDAYFVTERSFGHAQRDGITYPLEFSEADSITFKSVTGIPGEGVFLALTHEAGLPYACGTELLLWYDGVDFHPL